MATLILINPNSGGGTGRELYQRCTEYFRAHPQEGEAYALPDFTAEALAAKCQRFNEIVIAGGDGTASSVVSYLVNSPARIGIWPLGTGNDLARECGVLDCFTRGDIHTSLRRFRELPASRLSLWALTEGGEEHVFCNYCSFGFEALAVATFHQWRAGRVAHDRYSVVSNRFQYLVAGMRHLGYRLPPLSMSIDDGVELAQYDLSHLKTLVVANVRSMMGMGYCNDSGNPFDTTVEVVTVGSVTHYLKMLLPRALRTEMRALRARRILLRFAAPVALQIDGEAQSRLVTDEVTVAHKGAILLAHA